MPRIDGRPADAIRPLRFDREFVSSATGSCLIGCGRTRVLCTVCVEESVPPWLDGKGQGWITAEYNMLPASTGRRKPRDGRKGRVDGRTVEIQRLVGRSLRPSVDLKALGPRTLTIDCDVIEADGGTRTTAINGATVALQDALDQLIRDGRLERSPLISPVGAISVGIVEDQVLTDLCYQEDSRAQADMNVVMDGQGRFLEVQASAEGRPFSKAELDQALAQARCSIEDIQKAMQIARGDAS